MAKAQVPPGPVIPETITEEEVHRFVEDYVKRFMELNLEVYMDLFSKEAVENRALPYGDIREAYRKTIQGNHSIQFDVKIYIIQTYAESAFASGRYRITQTFKGGRTRTFKGNIQWLLTRQGKYLKIREINYGIDP
jgi:ketosteroid isomerase-like protein